MTCSVRCNVHKTQHALSQNNEGVCTAETMQPMALPTLCADFVLPHNTRF